MMNNIIVRWFREAADRHILTHGADKFAEDLLKRAAQVEAMTCDGWINVKDKLPKDDKKVLVISSGFRIRPGDEIMMARCNRYNKGWWRDGIMQQLHYVTHWMPLPAPPQDGRGEG